MVNLATDVSNGRYLKASDVPEPVKWTIAGSDLEQVNPDEPKKKPVIYFKEAPDGKGMALSVEAQMKFQADYGDEIDDFIGQEIVLFTIDTSLKGKPVKGLRLRAPKDKANQEPEVKF